MATRRVFATLDDDEGPARLPANELQEANETLQEELQDLRTRYHDLIEQVTHAEEENIQISKALVELKIENQKMKQRSEEEKDEMINKLLRAENNLSEAHMDLKRWKEQGSDLDQRYKRVLEEKDAIMLEIKSLKENYTRLRVQYESEVKRMDETGLELINVVKERDELEKKMDQLAGLDDSALALRVSALEAERASLLAHMAGSEKAYIDRLRELVDTVKNAQRGGAGKGYSGSGGTIADSTKLGNAMDNAMDALEKHSMKKGLATEVSDLREQLLTVEEEKRKLEYQMERMKEAGVAENKPSAETELRLRRRVREVEAELEIWKSAGGKGQSIENELRVELDRLREENEQFVKASMVSRPESASTQMMQKRLEEAEEQTKVWKERYNVLQKGGDSSGLLKDQLKDFMTKTQLDLEREKAQLTMRANSAEEQLQHMQRYMQTNIANYRKEIKRLQAENEKLKAKLGSE